MLRRNLRIPVVNRSASAELFSESESLQFDGLSYSRKKHEAASKYKGSAACTSCLYQDTITAAKKLREMCIDSNSRNKGITVSSAGAGTVTSYAGSLSRSITRS